MKTKLFLFLPILLALAACSAAQPATTSAPEPDAAAEAAVTSTEDVLTWGYTQPCEEPTGVIQNFEIGVGDGSKLPAKIYLPPCYESDAAARFPVLYLFHGANGNPDTWIVAGATSTADQLLSNGEIEPFLIVMPATMDFAPEFDVVFTNVMVPFVDANYRTVPDRRLRGLGGMSAGAGLALRVGAQNPQIARVWGLHSVAAVEGIEGIDAWLGDIPDQREPHIYMDVGNLDPLLEAAVIINSLLIEDNLPHTFIVRAGEHNMAYWTVHLPEYLNWYDAAFSDD